MNNAVNKVITFAFSAGNDDADACNSSPASAANAITVGAINSRRPCKLDQLGDMCLHLCARREHHGSLD